MNSDVSVRNETGRFMARSAPSPRPAAADMFVVTFSLTNVDFFPPYTFLQNEPPERCSGQFARGTTRVYREFFRCGAQLRTAQFTAASDQTVPARRFNVRGTPRRRRMGERIRPIPVQRTARRAWARADLGRRDAKEGDARE